MIAREGLVFALPLWIIATVGLLMSVILTSIFWITLAALLLLTAAFVTYFFRDPERMPPAGDHLILSPGDGKVILIEKRMGSDGSPYTLVSIFLSVFDVHINRVPISGRVERVVHLRGKFLKAFLPQAVTENERTEIEIRSPSGKVRFSQVAGILARRIVCRLKPAQLVERGSRFGLIRFGSRIDLYLDGCVCVKVAVGDRVRGGESVIGSLGVDG